MGCVQLKFVFLLQCKPFWQFYIAKFEMDGAFSLTIFCFVRNMNHERFHNHNPAFANVTNGFVFQMPYCGR